MSCFAKRARNPFFLGAIYDDFFRYIWCFSWVYTTLVIRKIVIFLIFLTNPQIPKRDNTQKDIALKAMPLACSKMRYWSMSQKCCPYKNSILYGFQYTKIIFLNSCWHGRSSVRSSRCWRIFEQITRSIIFYKKNCKWYSSICNKVEQLLMTIMDVSSMSQLAYVTIESNSYTLSRKKLFIKLNILSHFWYKLLIQLHVEYVLFYRQFCSKNTVFL